ncbi:major facilitator superfamily domain-containing protein [Mycena metata]|uniref:Major facilitator superfamily domain-containing protein n=1 Tax=Mycena metata TaxID=1033252 RepID=A0AAD7JQY3_9AGAR|nr:major facilitator superfamily domain-containing protein [Mycena metata]
MSTEKHSSESSHSGAVTPVESPKAPPSSTQPSTKPAVTVSSTKFALIMCSIWIGNFVAFFNETDATASMHVIGKQFNSENNQNWIATAYLLGFTVTQTLLGKFSDVFGRGRVFNATLFIFACGTLWAGLAESMRSLIGARVLQGIGAAGRQTVGVIVIIDLTTPYTRGFWLGFFNLSLSLGIAFGPVIGAVVSIHTTWRWLFWITLILIGSTFCIAATAMNYPVPHRKQGVGIVAQLKDVDWVGCVLAVFIAALICIPVEMGNKEFAWASAPIIVMFVLGAALMPIFVIYELRYAKNPIVDMHLFKLHNVQIAVIINFLTGAANFGTIFFLPRYFIDIKNSSLINESYQLFGLTLSVGVASVFGANLISQSGQMRLVGLLGAILYTLGSGLMLSVNAATSSAVVIVFSAFWGMGTGVLYQPSMVVGPMSVKPDQIAGISGFLAFLRTLGGTFSTALLTSIFETSFTSTLRGVVPDDLLSQGLGLADNHLLYPQYSDTIVAALVKAFHLGTIPTIVFGVVYGGAVVLLKGLDFVPAWRKKQIEAAQVRAEAEGGEKA